MPTLNKDFNINVPINPFELAQIFCEMDGAEQASFFNSVALFASKWERPFVFQLQAILDSRTLNAAGYNIMKEIGDYSTPTK